jgi:hypothetical protein
MKFKAEEFTFGQTKRSMKETGSTIKCMDMVI